MNSTEENKCKSMKNKAEKMGSKAIIEKAEERPTKEKNCPNWMLRQVKRLTVDRKEVDGEGYMKGNDGRLCFNEKEVKSGKVERRMVVNDKKDLDHNVESCSRRSSRLCKQR